MLNASGRGVFLIRQFMDDVVIRPARGGGMEVRMTKRIRSA
jgi:anti-sigma regulatory factor (Ser/Thr protein kinase)